MSIVVGYLPGPTGPPAVTEALQQARWRHVDVVVVTVGCTHTDVDGGYLAAAGKGMEGEGIPFRMVHRDYSALTVADALLEVALEVGAEMIVVGPGRLPPALQDPRTNTAHQLMLRSTCPVLVVAPYPSQ